VTFFVVGGRGDRSENFKGGLGGWRRAVELAMQGGKLARGDDEGPWATLPSTGRGVNSGRGKKRGPEQTGTRIDARSPVQAAATKEGLRRPATQPGSACQRRLALSAGTRKEARFAGDMEGAQREATEWTI
jgi:hypothetical protein